jgi:hypothetical protein
VSKLIKISFAIATGIFRSTSRLNNRNEVKLFLEDVTWTNLQQETTAIHHLHRMKTISRIIGVFLFAIGLANESYADSRMNEVEGFKSNKVGRALQVV